MWIGTSSMSLLRTLRSLEGLCKVSPRRVLTDRQLIGNFAREAQTVVRGPGRLPSSIIQVHPEIAGLLSSSIPP